MELLKIENIYTFILFYNILNMSNKVLDTVIIKKIFDWCSGKLIPETKEDEDNFLLEASTHISSNCTKNPGKLGEWAVIEKLKLLNSSVNIKKSKILCPWLLGQTYIEPDVILDNCIIEVKTLRYFNSFGKRGCQGTGSEKIDSIFRKYSNIYEIEGKQPIVIFVADQMLEKNGKMFLDAFNKSNYNSNKTLEKIVPFYKNILKFNVKTFNDINDENAINLFNNGIKGI